jgi:lipid A 3-O-deacylase
MRVRRISLIVSFIFVFPSCVSVLFAEEEKQGPIFVVTEENDLFSNPFTADHTDRHYTEGLKLTYLGGDDEVPRWASKVAYALPTVGIDVGARNFGYAFGQNLYTPGDLLASAPITTDRPYGGWLYFGAILQRRGVTGNTQIPVIENFEVDLGMTGKASLAEATQENFHRWFFDLDMPRGWHNQLANEPGLLLKYQRLWRLSLNEQTARYLDFIPHVGGDLGNVAIFANLGATLRVGYNLPRDFGVQINDSPASANGGMTSHSAPFGFYLFGGVDGRAVAHNLFLDGNSFRSSASVERMPWVADLICGGAIQIARHFEVSYARVTRTLEFVGQKNADIFGSIRAKAEFRF